MLLVSVYFAGRFGTRPRFPSNLVGQWQAELPAGFKRPAVVKHIEGNRFVLSSGSSVFNGIYEWKNGMLTVIEPSDKRMMGLTWRWDGESLLLVKEPAGTPTGSSYVGTTLLPAPADDM